MTIEYKIKQLEKLLEKSSEIKREDSDDPDFKIWRDLVLRTLMKIYGDNSHQVKQFRGLKFFYTPMMSYLGADHTAEHLRCFRADFATAKKYTTSLIEEFQDEAKDITDLAVPNDSANSITKVFISHSSTDKDFVEELIDLLETIGLESTQIFCSSFAGYGIDLGQDFLARLREELDDRILVLFVLSKNFYASPISLCEMGATWVKTNEHIPILIPPFSFKDILGVIPLTQGFMIDDSLKLNLFKSKIEEIFSLTPIDYSTWERKRDRALARIKNMIQ
jgi:TIR domain